MFEKQGSEGLHAASSGHAPFSVSDWKSMSKAEQESVLMNYRLAFRKVGYVNWCEALGTVLANDEVKDGLSERGGFPVVQKEMMQWSLRVTAYAERLLNGMDSIQWSESLKTVQRNWIGRSEGAFIDFKVADQKNVDIKVFTTRPDTIFGCTFLVLAPDHDLVPSLRSNAEKKSIDALLEKSKLKSSETKTSGQKTVDGAWTGAYASNHE